MGTESDMKENHTARYAEHIPEGTEQEHRIHRYNGGKSYYQKCEVRHFSNSIKVDNPGKGKKKGAVYLGDTDDGDRWISRKPSKDEETAVTVDTSYTVLTDDYRNCENSISGDKCLGTKGIENKAVQKSYEESDVPSGKSGKKKKSWKKKATAFTQKFRSTKGGSTTTKTSNKFSSSSSLKKPVKSKTYAGKGSDYIKKVPKVPAGVFDRLYSRHTVASLASRKDFKPDSLKQHRLYTSHWKRWETLFSLGHWRS